MLAFITEHLLEILFGLISAGALGFCRYLNKQLKDYKRLLDEKEDEALEESIEKSIEPIREEIEELRKCIMEIDSAEKNHIDLIISSYRFRLIQLCKAYIKQGYMTQDQYDQLTEFYKLYKALGGNGQAQEYYERAIDLPIRPE